MKKIFAVLGKWVVVLITVVCFKQIGFAQSAQVGILFDQFSSARWKMDAKYISDKFDELGVIYELKVAHSDVDKQFAQAQKLITEGVDALVIVAVDGERASEIVELAKQKGVVVIAYDRLILNDKIDLYFSYDNVEAGRLQARTAISAVSKGNYVLLNGPESDFNAIQFRQGQKEVLEEYVKNGDIKIVNDIVTETWHEMETVMTLHEKGLNVKEIDCIVSAADCLSSGVYEFLDDDSELERIFLTGQDATLKACESIKLGQQNMTVFKPIKPLAETAALYTHKLINGKTLKGLEEIEIAEMKIRGLLFDPIVINKSNVDVNELLLAQLKAAADLGE